MTSPVREPRPFTEAAPMWRRVGAPTIALISGWLLLVAFYTGVFALSGPPLSRAIRGGFANGTPDALLALAAVAIARRLDASRTTGAGSLGAGSLGAGSLLRAHVARSHLAGALVLAALSCAVKSLLIWIDMRLFESKAAFRLVPGIIAWQAFVGILIYAVAAAAAHLVLIDRRLRAEEARAARAEALRAGAELSALRAQLNPHFLFNVLHSTLGMVRRDPALAEAALEGLGDLLRYALRVHRQGVDRTALRHEWAFMETYLGLEKIRLGDRLRIDRRVDEAALDHSVPTFSLQPLVENAVRHGIAPRAAGGRLSIEARIEGEALRLGIANDGDGRGAPAADDEGGMGLRVLRERLEVLYSGRARMEAGPTVDGGYRVALILPTAPDEPEADA